MKRIVATALALVLLISLCACGAKGGETLLYNYKDLSKYIEMPEYKGIEVSLDDPDVANAITKAYNEGMASLGLGETAEVASGTVQNGDTAHITYVGKINGEAFSGGSTDEAGTDLVIGSNSYIDGFEEGLIGAKVGETVVLDLKFPKNYHSADFAGKDVEFTVTVKYIKRTTYPEMTEDNAKSLGFESVENYKKTTTENCVKEYLLQQIATKAKVLEYPQAELDYYVAGEVNYYKEQATQSGYTFEDFLKNYNMDEKTFKEQIEKNYKNSMAHYMSVYYIARAEGLTIDEEGLKKGYEDLAKEYSMEVSEVKKYMNDEQVEFSVIYDNVLNFLYESAKIK